MMWEQVLQIICRRRERGSLETLDTLTQAFAHSVLVVFRPNHSNGSIEPQDGDKDLVVGIKAISSFLVKPSMSYHTSTCTIQYIITWLFSMLWNAPFTCMGLPDFQW